MMDRRTYAVWTVLLGLVIGLAANIFFYNKTIGLSVPLFALVVVAAVFVSARVMRQKIRLRNSWPILPILFFTAMVAVRADPLITALNIMAALGLGALVLHYLPLPHAIDEDTLSDYGRGTLDAGVKIPLTPFLQTGRTVGWLRDHRPQQHGPLLAVGRGLLFTVPLVVVFAALLGSADAVFGSYLNQVWRLLQISNVTDLMRQAFIVGFFGWFGCGALAYGVARQLQQVRQVTNVGMAEVREPEMAMAMEGAAVGVGGSAVPMPSLQNLTADYGIDGDAPMNGRKAAKKHPFTLGMIEASMMLGGVDLLFAAFVVIQFAYFFGGQANINISGYTYADYARRGFFELVAVSVLTLGLVLWLDWVTVRHDPRQTLVFRVMAVVMVVCTGVILFSAAQRMALYEQAYGFTHLRVYTHVFIAWMGVLFVVFLLALFRLRDHIFSVGTLVVIIGYLVTLNVMNVEQYIAQNNADRYTASLADSRAVHPLDACYLRTMSVDAVPAMLDLYEQTREGDPEVHEQIGLWLYEQSNYLQRLQQNEAATFFSLNLSRTLAWSKLVGMESELAEYYDPTASYRFCGRYGDSFD
jgi:hypothetical protein